MKQIIKASIFLLSILSVANCYAYRERWKEVTTQLDKCDGRYLIVSTLGHYALNGGLIDELSKTGNHTEALTISEDGIIETDDCNFYFDISTTTNKTYPEDFKYEIKSCSRYFIGGLRTTGNSEVAIEIGSSTGNSTQSDPSHFLLSIYTRSTKYGALIYCPNESGLSGDIFLQWNASKRIFQFQQRNMTEGSQSYIILYKLQEKSETPTVKVESGDFENIKAGDKIIITSKPGAQIHGTIGVNYIDYEDVDENGYFTYTLTEDDIKAGADYSISAIEPGLSESESVEKSSADIYYKLVSDVSEVVPGNFAVISTIRGKSIGREKAKNAIDVNVSETDDKEYVIGLKNFQKEVDEFFLEKVPNKENTYYLYGGLSIAGYARHYLASLYDKDPSSLTFYLDQCPNAEFTLENYETTDGKVKGVILKAVNNYYISYYSSWNQMVIGDKTEPSDNCAFLFLSGNGVSTGITEINYDCIDSTIHYYNLNGLEISADNLIPGLYIRREGSKVSKILVK